MLRFRLLSAGPLEMEQAGDAGEDDQDANGTRASIPVESYMMWHGLLRWFPELKSCALATRSSRLPPPSLSHQHNIRNHCNSASWGQQSRPQHPRLQRPRLSR